MDVQAYQFEDAGQMPNNELALLVYDDALSDTSTTAIEQHLARNDWGNAWVNGIYGYHHFHSNTHEVIAVASGEADVTFGGENGETLHISAGDVVVIPAGVGHRRQSASVDFEVVGAYPGGKQWDLQRPETADHDEVRENIQQVPLPDTDPVQGEAGALHDHWT